MRKWGDQDGNWIKDWTKDIWNDVKQNTKESVKGTYNSVKDSITDQEFKSKLLNDFEDISFSTIPASFAWGANEIRKNFSNPEIQSVFNNLENGITIANAGVLLYNGTRLARYSEEMRAVKKQQSEKRLGQARLTLVSGLAMS